jgi:tetratricopeptide (TPR) repeat protein
MTALPVRRLTFSAVVLALIRFPFSSKPSLKIISTTLLALGLLLVLLPAAPVLADEAPPLPDDLKIEAPGSDVPADISNFLGIWEGEWIRRGNRTGPHLLLAVEKVSARKATVVLSLGKTSGRFPRGWHRQESIFSEMSGRLELPVTLTSSPPVQNLDILFFINDKGNLEGRLFGALAYGYYTADIELRRKKDVAAPRSLSPPAGGEVMARKQGSGKILPSQSNLGKYWKMRNKMSTRMGLNISGGRSSPEFIPYSKGYDYLMEGQWDQAIAAFNETIRITPKHGESFINRGIAYGCKGQYEQAVDDFSKFIALDQRDAGAYHNRGLAYALKGQYDASLADFDKALTLAPKDAKTLYLRGFVYFKKNQADKARADYQASLGLNSDWVRQGASQGEGELPTFALIMEGKKEPARQDKEHKKKGKTLAQQGEYAQALSELDQALSLDPKDVENYTRRGGIYTLQKQYDKAIDDFNRALELDPRYAKAYYNRALAFYYQGKYDQALSDLQKTIELKPKDAEAYHNRGLVYIEKKDYGKAIDDFNMAIALNPKLADAYFNKAGTCERAGRPDEAQEAYAAYLKVAPPEARARIEQARGRLGQARQLE